jgi:hypothetical protein
MGQDIVLFVCLFVSFLEYAYITFSLTLHTQKKLIKILSDTYGVLCKI